MTKEKEIKLGKAISSKEEKKEIVKKVKELFGDKFCFCFINEDESYRAFLSEKTNDIEACYMIDCLKETRS